MSDITVVSTPVIVEVSPQVYTVTVSSVGAQGATGAAGVVAATSPITYNSGTQTVGIDQTAIAISGTQITSGTIDSARIPTLNQNTTGTASNVTGTVAVANGGTGKTTLTSGQVVVGNGTGAVTAIPVTTNGSTASALVQLDVTGSLSVASGTLGRVSAGTGGITTTGNITTGAGKAVNVVATGGGTSVITAQGAVNLSLPAGSGTLALTSGNITGTAANVTGTVAITNGGTGAITASTALTNLGAVATTLVGAVNGVASLDGSGLIPTSQLPPLAISDTFVVASQAAMLALTAQVGDVAVRTDTNQTFILQTSPPTVLGNWVQILTPPAITSITASSPLTGGTITSTGTIGISDASTTVKGAVQLTDSTASTSTTTAATPNSVKTAYDLANGKVSSVSGTLPISVTTGVTPTVSIASATTTVAGAVQLTDSTSSTSTTTAATPNSVKTVADSDALKAPLASPALTGTPTTTTAAVDTNTTQIASTAFVLGQASATTPVMDGTAAVGTSTRYARADHVHGSDTSKASLTTSNTFTTGTQIIATGADATVGLRVKRNSATQSANILEVTQSDGSTILAKIDSAGAITTPNITDTALSTAGIVTNTSAGLLGTTSLVPIGNAGTGHTYGAALVGKAVLITSPTKATNDTTPEAVFRNSAGTIQYFNVEADTTYAFDGMLQLNTKLSGTVASARLSLIYYNTSALTTLTEQSARLIFNANQTSSTYVSVGGVNAANTNADGTITSTAALTYHINFRGFIRTNATTAGRINIGATQSVAGSSAAPDFILGSFMNVYKVGTGATNTFGNWS